LTCALLVLAVPVVALGASLPQLKLCLPPVIGSLPIALADRWGLFESHGVDLQIVAENDDSARLQAFTRQQVDGMVCDVTTAIRLYASGADVIITSTINQPARKGTLAILTTSCMATSKGIASFAALLYPTPPHRPCPITFPTGGDLEFVLDAVLAAMGYQAGERTLYADADDLPNLAMRLAVGGVEAALLPEPYVTYLERVPPSSTLGCSVLRLWESSGTQLPPSVVVFRREVLQRSDGAIRAFYDALCDTLTRMNAMTPSEMVDDGVDVILSLGFFPGVTRASIPASVLGNVPVPRFAMPGRLDPSLYKAILDWMNRKRYTWQRPSYEELTTTRYLP
jgi:ABC-type nitrate/sulfonate/bicarbonate transport system substrate-binding protein